MMKLKLICGLCVLESEELAIEVGEKLLKVFHPLKIKWNLLSKEVLTKPIVFFDSIERQELKKG